ncbi:MAG: glycosyltransferase family 9 protein [Bacteroidota bacterium]|nr:glycosyltransferase family 9 protein [Bacteroidota bacterium]
MQKKQKILVIRLSAMGDVAMTVPVLHALAQQYPHLQITMLSKPAFEPIFDSIPNIRFVAVDTQGKHKGFWGIYRLFEQLKSEHFDYIADLHNVLRSIILRTFFKIRNYKIAHINKGRSEKKALTRANNKIFKPLTSTHQRYAQVFEQLGFKLNIENINLPKAELLNAKITTVTGQKSEKWIGVAPFAQHQPKIYPLDLMQQIIDYFANNQQYKLFLFGGGKKEVNILNQIRKDYKNVIVVAGKLNLSEELQLISNLNTMLSMDSANAHLAAIYGVKTFVVFGATHPYAGFMPFNQPKEHAFIPDLEKYPLLPTSIYGNKFIKGYEDVMRTIDPNTIIQKLI